MPRRKIKLGDEIEDVVSKAKGIAIGYVTYLDGSSCWIIQIPIGEDENKPREMYVPEGYCKRLGNGVYPEPKPILGFTTEDISDAKQS